MPHRFHRLRDLIDQLTYEAPASVGWQTTIASWWLWLLKVQINLASWFVTKKGKSE